MSFPFLVITIACGAVSGFHALMSSGATPKMLENETHARFIGYGGMLAQSFGAVMALLAAWLLAPAKSLVTMRQVVFNDRPDAALCLLFMGSVLACGVTAVLAARGSLPSTASRSGSR